MYKRTLAAIFAGVALASGQRLIEFSAKIGAPVTESFETNSWGYLATGNYQGASATRRYTAGAGVGLRLPHGFGAEFGFLYKRLGFDINTSLPPFRGIVYYRTSTTANSWEFPMLGVYRFSHWANMQPHLSGGVSFRAASGVSSSTECYTVPGDSMLCGATHPTQSSDDQHIDARSHFGGVVAAGIETRIAWIRLSPEIRFTRWRADAPGPETPEFDVRSNPNQLDVLLGIRF